MSTMASLSWGLLYLVLLLLQSPATYSSLERRCQAVSHNETASFLERLQQTPCVACPEVVTINFAIPPIENHVVLLVTSQLAFEKAVVLAAGLLLKANRVTLLCSSSTMPHESAIRQLVLQHLPCNEHILSNSLLRIQHFKIEGAVCRVDPHPSPGDILRCSVQNAEIVAQQLARALKNVGISPITTLVMEATSMAGLIVAETMLVPVIAWKDNLEVLRLVLGAPQETVTLRTSWSYVASRLQDRLRTFDLSSGFCAYNKLRRKLGLPRIRRMADYWNRGCILMTQIKQAKAWQDRTPNLIVLDGPLVPPCIPCSNDPSLNTTTPKILVTIVNAESPAGRRNLRKLLQGLSLARASLLEYRDCDDCWNATHDFEVVRLASPANMTLPSFVHSKPGAFLDGLAHTHNMVLILSMCDDNNRWILSLGPPVLCSQPDWSHRDIAVHVLRLLRNPPHIEPTRANDLDKVVSVIQVASQVKKKHGDWTDGGHMMEDLLYHLEMGKEEDESDLFGSILLYPAWTIVVLSILYLLLKDTWKPQQQLWRRRQPSTVLEAFWMRLPDLDRTWAFWCEWAQEQLAEPVVERPGNSTPVRTKRRATKKKH